MSPRLGNISSAAHMHNGMPSNAAAAADAEAMWHLSRHLNSLQMQQAPLAGKLFSSCFGEEQGTKCVGLPGSSWLANLCLESRRVKSPSGDLLILPHG